MISERMPEDVLCEFLFANLRPDEATIRSLIMDHPDAALLWRDGSYPEEIATALEDQYEEMGIARIEEEADRVLLQSTASPCPLAVIRIDGEWRVDASPIIEFRKGLAQIRQEQRDRE